MVLKILARLHLDLGHFLKRKVRYSPRGSLNSISQIFETVKVKLAAIINSLFPVKIQVVVLMKWTFSTAIHCFTLVMRHAIFQKLRVNHYLNCATKKSLMDVLF